MSALPIAEQVEEIRKTWQELIWEIADGDALRYTEIKKMDVFEFYPFFDKWKDRRKRQIEAAKAANKKR